MEEKKDKPRIAIAGGGYGMIASALAAAAFADHLRHEPVIDTRQIPSDDFVVFDRNEALESRLGDLFGPLADEISFEKAKFETSTERYKRLLREQAEREKPIIDAAESKRQRKAEKRARDAAKMEKKHV